MDEVNTQLKMLTFISQITQSRWIITLITFLGTAIAIIFAFLMPKQYLTVASVKISGSSSFNVSSLLTSTGGGGGLGSLMDFAVPSGGADVDYLYSILTSRSVLDSMIVKFDLKKKYESSFIEDTRAAFLGNMFIEVNYQAGLIYFGIYSEIPQEAARLTNALIYYLNNNYSRMSSDAGKNNRINLEKRYSDIMSELIIAEDSLTNFQEIYGVLEPTIQMEVTLRMASSIKTQLMLKEIEADSRSKFFGGNSPESLFLEVQLEELRNKYNQLLSGVNQENLSNEFFIPLDKTPELTMNYYKLFREVEINSELLKVFIPLIEQAKMQELKETSNLLILDKGVVPEKKSKPRRMIIALIGFGLSFAFAFTLVIVKINLRNMKSANPEAFEKIQSISNVIISDFSFRRRKRDV